MSRLLDRMRGGQVGVTADCLRALLRGEDSAEAEVGALALADGLRELTLIRKVLSAKPQV